MLHRLLIGYFSSKLAEVVRPLLLVWRSQLKGGLTTRSELVALVLDVWRSKLKGIRTTPSGPSQPDLIFPLRVVRRGFGQLRQAKTTRQTTSARGTRFSRLITAVTFLVYTTTAASAQNFTFPDPTERIYPISASTTRALLDENLDFQDLPDPGTPYPVGTKSEALPPGHYLTTQLSGPKVTYTYFNTYRYQVEVQPTPGKFSLRVYDPAGQARADASVLADGKPARYRLKREVYLRRDWQINHLEIAVDGDTLFYSVTESINQSRLGHDIDHASANPLGYVVLAPYRIVRNSYRYVKRGIGSGYWRMYRYPFKRAIQRLKNPANIVGYVTTSQPVYRPGDTLRISAYLTKPKGRPLVRDSVNMVIYTSGNGRNRWQREEQLRTKISRQDKGRYVYEIAIPDDWPLDREYHLSLYNYDGIFPRDIAPDISFRVEDYELAEYELEVEPSDDARLPGSAWLDIRTEDINGLALPQGKLAIKVITNRVTTFTDTTSLRLPDLLYRHEEGTDNRRERRVMLPDSLFPHGFAVEVKVVTQLTGPSGEYKEAKNTMIVDRRYPQLPEITVVGDSLLLALNPASTSVPKTATLETISPQADTLRQSITLPQTIAIDHAQRAYRLVLGQQAEQHDNADMRPTGASLVRWSRDTLRLQFSNPHGQLFRWELWQDSAPIATGDQDNPAHQQASFTPRSNLQLNYQYFTAGSWKTKQQNLTAPAYDELTSHPNVLDLQLDQPLRIRPGETVRVAVQATDQKGKPAPNVRLTAGTYNARFKDSPVKTPSYLQKDKRKRRRQSYSLKAVKETGSPTPPAWLLADYGQDSVLAYQLRYPDPAFSYLRSLDTLMPDSNYQSHFAPFVVLNHQLKTVRTVFVDDRLVYWYHPDILTPYSIPVDSGHHEVSLRIDGYRFTKHLFFPARQQLVISFDAQRWVSAGWQREKVEKVPDAEVNSLFNRVFTLSRMSPDGTHRFRDPITGIIQSGRNQQRDKFNPLGLATPGNMLTVWAPKKDSLLIPFEPRAGYRITAGRDRLYPLEKATIKSALAPSFRSGPWLPKLPVYQYASPTKEEIFFLDTVAQALPALTPEAKGSRLQLAYHPTNLKRWLITPVDDDAYYKMETYGTNIVAAGTYDLIFQFHGDSVREQRVVLAPEELFFVPYDRETTLPFAGPKRMIKVSATSPKAEQPAAPVDYIFRGDAIRGILTDENGEPLIGASILVKGTSTGSVADLDGEFALQIPAGATEIVVSYTGYGTKVINLAEYRNGNQSLALTLEASSEMLEEVVVVGYGTTAKGLLKTERSLGYTVPIIEADVTQVLQGKATGIVIRGLSSTKGASLLYIVNGTPVDNIDQLRQDQIAKIEILKDASATAIYGAAAANGVVLITTHDGAAGLVAASLPPPATRTSFADYAAFHPELRTDRQGRAVFDVTFPDDITAWNTFAVGQDRKRRVGFATARTNAFLPLQAQLYLPRFLVAGDESEAATLAINRTEEDRKVTLTFTDQDKVARTQDAMLEESLEERYPINANGVGDSLSFQFTLQTTEGEPESDGERRSLPVFPVGTEMTAGEHFLLTPEQTDLPLDFIRPERGPVTLRIFANRVERLLADVDHVVDYPYACTEQTASRLLGLLALKQIQKVEGATFRREGAIRKMIRRLEKTARADGGYGWWPSSPGATPWISGHVFRALSAASTAGYSVNDLQSLRQYLISALPELAINDQLSLLLTLGEAGFPTSRQELDRLDTIPTPTDYQYLARTRLHQQRGDTISVDSVLARSTAYAGRGRYWGTERRWFTRQPLGDRLTSGLLAHDILREAGRDGAADEAAAYLLGRTAGSQPGSEPLLGTNTLESARLIAGLLPDLLEDEDLRPPNVTVSIGNQSNLTTALPYVQTIVPATAPNLRLSRTGSGPILVSLHQRWFDASPSATDAGFTLSSQLIDERGRQLSVLTRGQTAYLDVTITTTADADYVLLEVPIPAGCSFANRSENPGPSAVHREYRRDRVAIFCDRLAVGTHTYRVSLAPRFSGNYTINPARAEMQYLPAVHGNTGLGKVKVGE